MTDANDLVSRLSEEDRFRRAVQLRSFSPDDGKYADAGAPLAEYLSSAAEWLMCARVQVALIRTRAEFGQASQQDVDAVSAAYAVFDPINAALLEGKLRHDQLAVIEELGRHLPPQVKALLHPGTTSYDILDTARTILYKTAWFKVRRPVVAKTIDSLCTLSEKADDLVQVGRTHLQDTSPVTFGLTLSSYAARLADRVNLCDSTFDVLKGKISGIVGTGASIDMVIGEGKSLSFERAVLEKLDLEPDYTATQIVQKERLADAGHAIVTLMRVLGDFANDMRLLYSSATKEVSDSQNAARLGGSSADAGKNNPMDWENIAGKVPVVESGMRILYELISSDLQRDLRGSVQARYQPQGMMVETFESFTRANKILPALVIDKERVRENLTHVCAYPSEAMTAILRGEPNWVHPEHGLGHDFVKTMMRQAKKEGKPLLTVCLADPHFAAVYETFSPLKQSILSGNIEAYIGSARERATINRESARVIISNHA